MEKAFDIKVLADKLKKRGLDIAEEALMIVIDESVDWAVESAAKSENAVVKVVAPILVVAKPHLKEIADKIDGEDDYNPGA